MMQMLDFEGDHRAESPSGNINSDSECQHSPHDSGYVDTECSSEDAFNNSIETGYFDKDMSVRLASDADVSIGARSLSSTLGNNASCDGPSSDNCASGFILGGEREAITFCPDYIDHCGTHYLESVVIFSRSCVEVRNTTVYGDRGNSRILLELDDIVKIESEWSARCETGAINVYFIPNEVESNDAASEVHKLKFLVVDSNWYEKKEAIESLDLRYKALWSVLLDTGMDQCSVLLENDATMLTGSYFPKFDKPFQDVIFPKGDPDAVSISKRDVDLLLPDTFVNDTVIDFYIMYLKTKQNSEEKKKFHFFNSFFFRKLADMDKDPSSAFDGRAAFLRVRKWTRKVNLVEKDFIFIPVNYNYHWSLIVVCYFGEVASYADGKKSARVPCILHMDSLRGNHVGLKDLLQSYLWEEWKERHNGSCHDLHSKFSNLKFISLELPQQQNAYDCGLFLLHYVELFLDEVPPNFSVYNITPYSNFLQSDWFPPGEASMKRGRLERLINDLIDAEYDNCSPAGPGLRGSYERQKTGHQLDNGDKNGTSSECWRDERPLCWDRQGIEMTLLPASSPTNQCSETSRLVLSELLKPETDSHAFHDSAWEAFGNKASLDELSRPTTEDEGAGTECFMAMELNEPVFGGVNDITAPPTSVFPYSSVDFRLETVQQASRDDAESSPVTSEEVVNAEESNVDNCDRNGDPVFLKNLPEFCPEANQLPVEHASKRRRLTTVDCNGEEELASDFLQKDDVYL